MVHNLLEVTADLTGNLEMMIVDDGSTDNTEEVAMDLCRQYPQVKTVRYAKHAGHQNAIRVGLANTGGDVVLIQNIDAPICGEAIRELWNIRNNEELAFARSEPAPTGAPVPVMHSQPTWSGGTQMLRRDAIELLFDGPQSHQPINSPTQQPKSSRVTRTDAGKKSTTAPVRFQQLPNVEMQADR